MQDIRKRRAHKRRAQRRLFFAIKPNEPTVVSLLEAQHKVVSAQARAVPAENLHITLAFIGGASAQYQQCLETAAAEVRMRPFAVRLD